MHELSLAASLLETLEKAAINNDFSAVNTAFIEIGELSCVDSEALRFALESIAPGTLLQDANLDIKLIPGELQCYHCNTVFPASELHTPCPSCQQFGATITAGNSACLTAIDVASIAPKQEKEKKHV